MNAQAQIEALQLSIEEYTEDRIPAVQSFNNRLLSDQLIDADLRFPETHISMFPKRDGVLVYQQQFLVLEKETVRGAFLLTHEQWRVDGVERTVSHYRLPVSEGIRDPKYKSVAPRILTNALERQPFLYCLGMGGRDGRLAKNVVRNGWSTADVPFFFHIANPTRFFREFPRLRQNRLLAAAAGIAAATGLGTVSVKTLQAFRRRASERLDVHFIDEFGSAADSVWEAARDAYKVIAPRNARTLQVRYPEQRFVKIDLRRGNTPVGWAVLLDTPMKDNKYFGNLRVGTIVDCLSVPADAPAVIAAASDVLIGRGVDLVVTNQSHAAWKTAIRSAGFSEGPSNYLFAVSPKLAEMLAPLESRINDVYLNRGDGPGPTRL